jgi:D-glycero-alpha-D-manno-heptose-7-phosphate kinase
MIITRTPMRVSFIGGGSDLRDFYCKSGGAVISTSIDKYMYISSHPYFNRKVFQLKYSKTEQTRSLNDIQHPIFREVFRKHKINGGIEITSSADIPAGTGLGSSSSFTVGLLHNLHVRSSKLVTKEMLADEASNIEIEILKEPIGKQDQYAAAYGGLNLIEFQPDDSVRVEMIAISKQDKLALEKNLMMFYTKSQRTASSILSKQKSNMSKPEKFALIQEMIPFVYQLRDALYQRELDYLGEVLHKGWLLKRKIAAGISNKSIDESYDKAIKAGAIGGKLLGAGGGGFLLFYCPVKKQDKVRAALKGLYEMDFSFDHEGSKLIYLSDNDSGNHHGFFE